MKKFLPVLFCAAAFSVSAQTPLTDFAPGEHYKGYEGGLYGGESNQPPPALRAAAEKAAKSVEPLDASGKPAANGRMGFVAIGMSNAAQKFAVFRREVNGSPSKNGLQIVNAAVGGMDAVAWARPQERRRKESPDPWENASNRVQQAGLTNAQVQVVWMLHAHGGPARYGAFPKSADALAEDISGIIARAKQLWPNLKLVHLSSRAYAGYAKVPLNPEPFAYESGFAVRSAILKAAGTQKGPVVVWGPYFWANGKTPRRDGLVWNPEDFTERDGTHPSESGAKKAGEVMKQFFTQNPISTHWFAP